MIKYKPKVISKYTYLVNEYLNLENQKDLQEYIQTKRPNIKLRRTRKKTLRSYHIESSRKKCI